MPQLTFCDFCGVELESSREFVFQMEMEDFAGNEELMEYLENSTDYHVGEPLRLCKACHDSVVRNRDENSEESRAIERDTWRFQMALRFGCGLMVFVCLSAIIIDGVTWLLTVMGFME